VTKLAPVPIARFAAMSVMNGFDTVLRFGWVPILISTLAGMVLEPKVMTVMPEDGEIVIEFGWMFVFVLVAVVTQAIFAVAWHRCVALGEARPGQRFYLRFGRREAVYGLVAFVVVAILSMGVGALPMVAQLMSSGQALAGLFVFGAPVMALFLLARLCLLLPMVAIAGAADPAKSWLAVGGNTWRVVAVLVLVGIPVLVVELVLISVFGSIIDAAVTSMGALGLVVSFLARFVSGLVFLALLGVIVSALTLLYMVLLGDETLRTRLPAPYDSFIGP